MDNPDLDVEKYSELLARFRPGVIDDPEEHERILTAAEELMDKGEALSREERKLLELLVLLIEVFEREVEEAEAEAESSGDEPMPRPHETLQRLMQSRGWDTPVLNKIFGNARYTGDVLSGLRAITKGQARSLGRLFGVPHKLFFNE